ncbi:MAG: hypothetical protein Q8M16_11550 [Pirellulaceae bacterium]|nr:hypothetical protein [Pirellulaceae bacterium]
MSVDWTTAIRLLHQGKWSIADMQQFSVSFHHDPAVVRALQIAVELGLALERASLPTRICEADEEFSKKQSLVHPHD